MLYFSIIIFSYCICLNFGFLCINEEFILSIVLILFFISSLFFLKNIILFYFVSQREKVYFFYAYLMNLNVNLFDKLIHYLSLIQRRSLSNLIEVYDAYFLLASNAVHASYDMLFGSLRFRLIPIFYLSCLPVNYRYTADINLTYFFFTKWFQSFLNSIVLDIDIDIEHELDIDFNESDDDLFALIDTNLICFEKLERVKHLPFEELFAFNLLYAELVRSVPADLLNFVSADLFPAQPVFFASDWTVLNILVELQHLKRFHSERLTSIILLKLFRLREIKKVSALSASIELYNLAYEDYVQLELVYEELSKLLLSNEENVFDVLVLLKRLGTGYPDIFQDLMLFKVSEFIKFTDLDSDLQNEFINLDQQKSIIFENDSKISFKYKFAKFQYVLCRINNYKKFLIAVLDRLHAMFPEQSESLIGLYALRSSSTKIASVVGLHATSRTQLESIVKLIDASFSVRMFKSKLNRFNDKK